MYQRCSDWRATCAIVVLLLWATSSSARAGTIAVTEFLADPTGIEAGEWVELFNYGSTDVDLTGWTISDEVSNMASLPSMVLPSGGYLILTADRAQFLGYWPSVADDPYVVELASGFALNNITDQIIISDATSAVVWRLAYINDDTAGRATFLTGDDFSITDYGTAADPGVSRSGDDLGMAGFLGYQQNDVTTDPFAVNTPFGEVGSPMTGGYTVIPSPGGIALLALWSLHRGRRRRSSRA